VAYHANVVFVGTMKINEHEMSLCRPILLIVLGTGLCVHACSYPGHPKISWIRVF
jgi:hypothetical protein